MRTTIDIPDELYREVKANAALEGRTVRDVVIESLKQRMEKRSRKRVNFPIIPSTRKDKIDLTREQVDEAVFG